MKNEILENQNIINNVHPSCIVQNVQMTSCAIMLPLR